MILFKNGTIMNRFDSNPTMQPKPEAVVEMKKELEKLAAETKNPKLVESFSNLLARKSAQVF